MQFFKDEQLCTSEFGSTCVVGTGLCVSRSGTGAGSLRVLAATACGSSLPRSFFPLCLWKHVVPLSFLSGSWKFPWGYFCFKRTVQ